MTIGTLIKTIQDIMRKDVGVDGDAQRISQMVWLLFLKIFDDKEQEWQLTIKGYKSPLQSRFRWSNWAKNPEGITGEELIDFVNNDLFPSLKKLATTGGVSPHGKVIGSVFEDAYNYMKSGTLLRQVINTIEDDVDFNSSTDRHLFNDIYEKILADLQSAGNAGEYYTPRAVTQFMVDILDPQLGQTILDPACGTGGFLTCTIERLKGQVKTAEDLKLLQTGIHGVEKKPLPHMLAMTNMMLHGIDVPTNIRHDNTLSRPLKDYGPRDRVDMVITNPPFGGMEEDGIENNFPKKYQTRETADLFMALIMHLLKHDTGKAAVVLPDGFLFGEGVKTTLKRELLEEFNLHTIVRLPKGVFSPYTGINTNILFFDKGGPTRDIWFFEHPYPEGYKSYSRRNPLTIEEFDREKAWWQKRKPTEHAWKVSAKEIAGRNYNLDCKNPHEVEVDHGDPDELMAEYLEISRKLAAAQEALKQELMQALGGQVMELLEKHFDIAFAAPDGIKRLRELILTLAMQGKLVPQDLKDQPASELLKEIEAEKKRLVKDGKIKVPKPLPEVKPGEVPYELPQGWEWVRLSDVSAKIHYGYTASANHSLRDIRLLRITDIQDNKVDWDSVPGCDAQEADVTQYLLANNDILIARTGGTVGKSYLVQGINVSAVFASYLIRVVPSIHVDVRYLKYFVEGPLYWKQLYAACSGTGQPNVNGTSLSELCLPLPPLAEQRRIFARIEQLMARCDELEILRAEREQKRLAVHTAALNSLLSAPETDSFSGAWQFITKYFGELYSVRENVAELRKAILQLAVIGKLVPQSGKNVISSVRLKEITSKIGSGATPSGGKSAYKDSGIPLIRSMNVHFGGFKKEGLAFIDEIQADKLKNVSVQESDVLLNITGASIGRVTTAPKEMNLARVNQHVCIIRATDRVLPKFLEVYLASPVFQNFVSNNQVGATREALTKAMIEEYEILLPSLPDQRLIVAKIDKLMAMCDELDQHIITNKELADRLMNSIISEVTGMKLTGEVMSTKAKDDKFRTGYDGKEQDVNGQTEIQISTKNFALRRFSMSSGYRSLLKLECLFHTEGMHNSEVSPVCLVGLNGSGKSNLIEAVADVFCFLELINLPWKRTSSDSSKYKKNDHFFELEYNLETNDGIEQVVIKKNKKTGVEFYVLDERGGLKVIPPGIEQLKLLPRRVIGYSSGLNETVSHPFLRTKTLYSEEVRDAAPKSGAPISESKNVIDTRSLYMDYESNAAILICNYIFKSAEELSVINDYTRVNGVASFTLRFNKKRAGRSGEGSIVRLTSELDSALRSFLRCAEKESQYDADREDYELEYNLDEKTVTLFKREFSSAEALFMAMHKWSLLNALVLSDAQRTVYLKEDVTKGTLERPPSVPPKDRIFNIADLKLSLSTPAITIDYSGLSDGEHQFIQVFGTVLLFDEPGSLFLFDEPESHFNPEWRTKFNVILNSLPNAKFHEFMISTHSPFLVSGSRGFNVFKFERHGEDVSCEPVKFETYGASFDDLLNKLFGVESMIDQSARAELEEVIRSGDKEAMENAVGNFAESREKRRLYQALIEIEGEM